MEHSDGAQSQSVCADEVEQVKAKSLNIEEIKAENTTQIAKDEKIDLAPAARSNKVLRSVRIKNVLYHHEIIKIIWHHKKQYC